MEEQTKELKQNLTKRRIEEQKQEDQAHFAPDYYICNPYTKQWTALPPTSRVHRGPVLTGFTCDHPYYYREELVGNRTSSNNIKLNAEYKYRVVRIPAVQKNCLEFTVEIYSSETSEWRERCLQISGLLIGVDPFNNINRTILTGASANTTGDIVVNNELCRFVQFHKPEYNIERVECLGVCQGRLRMCHFDLEDPYQSGIVCVWEPKEVEEEDDQKADGIAGRLMKWRLIKKVNLKEILVAENSDLLDGRQCRKGRCFARVRAFDTNDEDILYIELEGDIVTCNFRTRTSFERERIRTRDGIDDELTKAFPLLLPRWPTPLPN
ncbi:unnamed protein product [Prunus armeniaca]